MKMKTPNPKTTKSKPKRKPREWIRYMLIYPNGTPSDVMWAGIQELWKVRGEEFIKVKVREVVE